MNRDELVNWIEANAGITHSRSSGPGGQNVNKVNTKVTLHIMLAELPIRGDVLSQLQTRLGNRINSGGELVVSSDETRSQPRNRELAVLRAASLIEGAMRKQKKRRKTKPTRSSVEKRLSDKKRRSEIKRSRRDY